jgi:hypothetical protein
MGGSGGASTSTGLLLLVAVGWLIRPRRRA